MNDKGYSLRQAAKLSGVPTMTFHAWKEKGLITPDIADNKGDISLFSETMIERAKKIDAKRKAKKSADISGNLFADTVENVADTDNLNQNFGENLIVGTSADLAQNSEATLGHPADDREDDGSNDAADTESARATDSNSEPAPVTINADVVSNFPPQGSLIIEETAAVVDDDTDNTSANVTDDATNNDELTESVLTPAQIDASEVNSEAEGNLPMTIETEAEIITLDVRANRIRQLQADVQRGIIEIGFELIAAKKEIGHGGWADWLKENFDWTQQTANRFMRVSERFGKLNNVVQFQPATLQAMLALPEGDEERFIEAQADKGKPVESQSAREVQSAVKEWNQQRNSEETTPEICGKYISFLGKPLPHEIDDTATVNAPCVEGETISEDALIKNLIEKEEQGYETIRRCQEQMKTADNAEKIFYKKQIRDQIKIIDKLKEERRAVEIRKNDSNEFLRNCGMKMCFEEFRDLTNGYCDSINDRIEGITDLQIIKAGYDSLLEMTQEISEVISRLEVKIAELANNLDAGDNGGSETL